eukprot:8758104-Lingulodinium_polyedra.AAC.1
MVLTPPEVEAAIQQVLEGRSMRFFRLVGASLNNRLASRAYARSLGERGLKKDHSSRLRL